MGSGALANNQAGSRLSSAHLIKRLRSTVCAALRKNFCRRIRNTSPSKSTVSNRRGKGKLFANQVSRNTRSFHSKSNFTSIISYSCRTICPSYSEIRSFRSSSISWIASIGGVVLSNSCLCSSHQGYSFSSLSTRRIVLVGRNSHSRQNPDNRHHDHQLDQGKTLLHLCFHVLLLANGRGLVDLRRIRQSPCQFAGEFWAICEVAARFTQLIRHHEPAHTSSSNHDTPIPPPELTAPVARYENARRSRQKVTDFVTPRAANWQPAGSAL